MPIGSGLGGSLEMNELNRTGNNKDKNNNKNTRVVEVAVEMVKKIKKSRKLPNANSILPVIKGYIDEKNVITLEKLCSEAENNKFPKRVFQIGALNLYNLIFF